GSVILISFLCGSPACRRPGGWLGMHRYVIWTTRPYVLNVRVARVRPPAKQPAALRVIRLPRWRTTYSATCVSAGRRAACSSVMILAVMRSPVARLNSSTQAHPSARCWGVTVIVKGVSIVFSFWVGPAGSGGWLPVAVALLASHPPSCGHVLEDRGFGPL